MDAACLKEEPALRLYRLSSISNYVTVTSLANLANLARTTLENRIQGNGREDLGTTHRSHLRIFVRPDITGAKI